MKFKGEYFQKCVRNYTSVRSVRNNSDEYDHE